MRSRLRLGFAIVLIAGVVSCLPGAAVAAPPDQIRTGGPSLPSDPKIAIVGTTKRLQGKPFTVVGGGQTVLQGNLTEANGNPGPWPRAYEADLSSITTPGSYRVKVGKVTSRGWVVDPSAVTTPMLTILRFFSAQNDGQEPSPLHGPSHLNDAVIDGGPFDGQRFDLTGGWMDAGNQVKLVNTTAFTVLLLEAAARLYPALAPQLTETSNVGLRWLIKAHPAPNLFVVQVGDQRDSDRGFSNPAVDDRSKKPGIGTRSAYADAGADQAGKAAAALATAALRATGEVRDLLVLHAREWYQFGKQNPKNGGASPRDDFYEDEATDDDMAAGALALYRATGEASFLSDAVSYLNDSDVTPGLNWGSIGSLVGADLCGALGLPPVEDLTAREAGCDALRRAASEAISFARTNAFATPASFDHFGQTAENGGRGAIAGLAARALQLNGGLGTAAGARDFLFGRNQWGASFVVGYGPRKGARHPHHWARIVRGPKFGPGQPVGAVVGGPTTTGIIKEQELRLFPGPYKAFNGGGAVYEDHLDNYVTSEPALDYTVASLFLLAVLGSS